MAYNTIIQQGEFTSDGTDKILSLKSGTDWVRVYNWTNTIAATQWAGTEWYWHYGMNNDDAITWFHAAASQVLSSSTCSTGYNGATYHGISILDSSDQTTGAIVATTGITAALPPLVTTATTTALVADSSVVRLTNTLGTLQFGGMDFTVGTIVAGVSFELAHAPQPIVSALAGEYRVVDYDPIYYPRRRYITAITAANPAVVTMSVTHDFTVGEEVRFAVSDDFDMTEMDGLVGTITAIDNAVGGNNTITVDINSAAFTAFAFPLTGDVPFTPAQVVPVGEDTAQAITSGVSVLGGAALNEGFVGIKLGTSSAAATALGSAGGTTGDIIKWVAGKSFSTLNE